MTLQEIREVKNLIKNATINKNRTRMFLDGKWELSLNYKIITTADFFRLAKYCKLKTLVIWISNTNIHIQ